MDNKELELLLDTLRTPQEDGIPLDIYRANELEIGGSTINNRKVLYNNTPILNQSLKNTPDTTNACGSYSQCKVINEMNYIEGTYTLNPANPVNFWKRTIEKYNGSLTGGSSLQGNIINAQKSGLISGYYSCWDVAEMKRAIDNGHLIVTGSSRVNWRALYYSKDYVLTFTDKPEFYHLFCIVGYDDEKGMFIIANSRGSHLFDNGLNYILYEDIGKLYSKIACIDQQDKHLIDKVRVDRELLDEAEKDKIWNGKNPDSYIKRYEVVLMAMRKNGIYGTDEELLRQAREIGIWNGENKYGNAQRYEVALIASRTTGKEESTLRNGNNPNSYATRRQAVLMLMR